MKSKIHSKLALLILMGLFFGSTSFIFQSGVKVIFKNESKEDFRALKVNIRGQKFNFFDLKSGKETEPITVPDTYRYCYAQAITSKDTVTCQPTDYVGEILLIKGKIVMNLMIKGNDKNRYMIIGSEFEE